MLLLLGALPVQISDDLHPHVAAHPGLLDILSPIASLPVRTGRAELLLHPVAVQIQSALVLVTDGQ